LSSTALGSWDDCWVRHKLARVLWVPMVQADAPGDRVIGAPILWSPSVEEDALLRADFKEIAALVALGELQRIDGRTGKVLQLRPKGADSHSETWALDEDAEWVTEMPRGFYLRPSFTGAILARELLLPG
jgi:DNA mismatch repair protein MutH